MRPNIKLIADIQNWLAQKVDTSVISNDFPMTANRTDKVVTESAALQGDIATRRKAWVSGALKNDSFIYSSKASTSGGTAVFYLTNDGTASGSAVFTNVYPDTIAIITYGALGNFQPSGPVVSGDNKSITASISQITNILGIATINSVAANGVDCRLYVMGD